MCLSITFTDNNNHLQTSSAVLIKNSQTATLKTFHIPLLGLKGFSISKDTCIGMAAVVFRDSEFWPPACVYSRNTFNFNSSALTVACTIRCQNVNNFHTYARVVGDQSSRSALGSALRPCCQIPPTHDRGDGRAGDTESSRSRQCEQAREKGCAFGRKHLVASSITRSPGNRKAV